jgi:AraC family transcriptional regulator
MHFLHVRSEDKNIELMKIYVKNMVCNRCKWVVKTELEKLGLTVHDIKLGEVEIKEDISTLKLEEIGSRLEEFGFELISDHSGRLIEQIKTTIIELVKDNDKLEGKNLSWYLSKTLHKEYSYLSKLFSETEGSTIEQFYILQKIERAKELLVYNEQSLTQIAFDLGYSSTAHLSAQFKKITGLTPSHFKELRIKNRKSLDEV